MSEKDPDKEDWYKQLQWHNAFVTGHTCEHCGKVIKSPFCICVASSEVNTFYHFHIRCSKEVCKFLGVKVEWEI
jgi:hypothetical protein